MAQAPTQAGDQLGVYLRAQEQLSLLRFITCGSVDDGKSTLIGRLLYESKLVFEDHLAALEADSARVGTQGDELDFALLVDGLAAEREQGITIDVAYRFFATERRTFIVADTPGHEQYTRNMVTGASTADVAVILIDARKGVLTQTRRHSYLVSLLGIRQVILAVNKLDLIGYSQALFHQIESDYRAFASPLAFERIVAIPLSALRGDNVIAPSDNTPWYHGPSLLDALETIEVADELAQAPLRLPVQWVNRPDPSFRGFSGLITAGTVRPGDRVKVMPSGRETSVTRVVTYEGDLLQAQAGQSVTVTLSDEIDVSRGDVIAAARQPPCVADQFQADIVWMSEEPLTPGRRYLLKIGALTVGATVSAPKHRVDVNTMQELATRTLNLNEIGAATITAERPIPFDPYVESRDTGGFILIDRLTNDTIAAGLLQFALRRSQNVHWQAVEVDKRARALMNSHRPAALWFTGLSGAGKSVIANLVEKRLHAEGVRTYLLDGDNIRHGLNKDLGFTDADRIENLRRVAEVTKLMVDAGLVVLVSFISPFREERQAAREMLDPGEFCEIYVDTPLALAEARDTKGLYEKARAGKLKNFTGIDSRYDPPENPEVHIRTAETEPVDAAETVIEQLRRMGVLDAR